MAKFITGKELEKAVYDIIWDAEHKLLIVSPFIKLDDYFKTLFDKHVNNPKIHFILVFGKNVGSVSGKTSYLVAGENMGPEKLKKAEKLGVKIISESKKYVCISSR